MIGSVVNLGSLFLDLAKRIYPDNKDIASAANAAEVAKHSYNVVSTTSVHQSASRAIIAPMTVIDDSILHAEYMNDLMQIVMLRDIVATLTHIALQSSTALGVKVADVVGSINPKRSGFLSLSGLESFNDSITGMENKTTNDAKEADIKNLGNNVTLNKNTTTDLMEYTPLAVGKVVTATLHTEAGTNIEFPLVFKQVPMPVTFGDLNKVFGAGKIEDGFSARWFQLKKTGEITTPEFLMGTDIIKERFRIRNEDLSGYYAEALKRESGNRKQALRTGILSVNTLANSFIMSKDTANQLELELGKRFDNSSSRDEIFKAVKANTIVIVNEDRGTFVFYTVGESLPETYTRKEIQVKSKKDNGSNTLNDLVNILNSGR